MGFDNSCNTGLSLGLGSSDQLLFFPKNSLLFDDDDDQRKKIRSSLPTMISDQSSFPSLTLGLSTTEVACRVDIATTNPTKKVEAAGESVISLNRQSSSISTVSTFSNSSVKREREFSGSGDQEVEEETKVSSKVLINNNIDDQDDQEGGARKKLRLTKEQSLVLEESFKEHSTLNPKQKLALAKRLNLSPRQVEVWFQNRRARTKLKQNELDCELLKTCCDSLTDENRRLKKEIQELKLIKLAAPFYMKFPAATLTICPSCEKIAGVSENSSKSPFPVGSKPQFFGGFTYPSAAPC